MARQTVVVHVRMRNLDAKEAVIPLAEARNRRQQTFACTLDAGPTSFPRPRWMQGLTSRYLPLYEARSGCLGNDGCSSAAAIRGVTRTEFVFRSSEVAAIETLNERPIIALDDEAGNAFAAMLNAPVEPDAEVKERFTRQPSWDG